MSISEIHTTASQWLSSIFDSDTQEQVKQLIENDSEQLEESFYKSLEFGTGGMRGIMGVGTNRINKYTLGKATQGLSNYLFQCFPNSAIKVAIAYDCRHNSKAFAKLVADVFSANGIKVFLFKDLRPTPELSFAVRYLKCNAGVMLTASHNPPEYNGYKAYWNDGGQIVPPQDEGIINIINQLDYSEINFQANEKLIEFIGETVDNAFIDAAVKNGSFNVQNRNELTIVFTPLHGTAIKGVPETLAKAGYENVHVVEQQRIPDGDFPTIKSPNPEEPEALKMAMDLADKINADIVIGTDPDCDRLGIAVRDAEGKMVLLNGNQAMVVMTNFLIEKWQQQGKLNGKQFIGSTIVSTQMVDAVAKSYNVEPKIALTGFKWIAKMISDFENMDCIGGGEESFGYMVGDFVRDKDAVTSTLLACEIAADAKSKNSTFYQELFKLYLKYGYYKECLVSITKKGIDGAAAIKQMMDDLRNDPLKSIAGSPVKFVNDYKKSTQTNLITGENKTIDLPKSDVLIFETEDGTRVATRPSGTEPKIKFYIGVKAPLNSIENAKKVEVALEAKIKKVLVELGVV